jgi:hypothetical protein
MKPMHRGIVIAVLQCLIVLSLAGKYAWDRQRLPRVWVETAPVDPNLPIRGRYVSLRLKVDGMPPGPLPIWNDAKLSIRNGRLTAEPIGPGAFFGAVQEPVAFFIPEHVPDPSRRAPGEELWVEVSVPRKGMPRPLRLGVKKNGVLTPLALE